MVVKFINIKYYTQGEMKVFRFSRKQTGFYSEIKDYVLLANVRRYGGNLQPQLYHRNEFSGEHYPANKLWRGWKYVKGPCLLILKNFMEFFCCFFAYG